MAVRDFSVSACLSHPRIKLLSQTVQSDQSLRCPHEERLGPYLVFQIPFFFHFSGYTITYNYMRCNTLSNILVATHWTHSEDSDQTERMPRLIWDLAGRTIILLVLSWGGSYKDAQELLLKHMFLDCNCIDKHFVETKNSLLRFLEHLL